MYIYGNHSDYSTDVKKKQSSAGDSFTPLQRQKGNNPISAMIHPSE